MLFQAHQVYGDEQSPIITINFIPDNVIVLDESPQIIRAEIEILYYDPGDGYHFMQIIRSSDGEIVKDTEFFPNQIDDDLWNAQILYYLEPDDDQENLIGEYGFRIYSEFGPSEKIETFSIVKSIIPTAIIPNTVEELVTSNSTSDVEDIEELEIENSVQPESKIPSWVHDIFVWYADEIISENELLTALEYLIAQEIIIVNPN